MTHAVIDQGAPDASPLVEPWNLVADGYVQEVLPMMEHFAREALQLASLPPSPHIVDVAAGPGTLAVLAARNGATVSAIDFSPGMVANLHRRVKEAGLHFADVRVGDGQDLPYDDDVFDGAFSIHGLMFFPDRAAGFRELRRVLRPGRRAVVSIMGALSSQLNTAIEIISSELPDLPIAQGEPPLSDPQVLSREMSAADFRQVTIHTVEYSETMPSISDFWGRCSVRPASSSYCSTGWARSAGQRFRTT
jgi:SAM-dependent methyltransferase